ncbi:FecR family protein [Ascidiimonas sp. W6]|uniref:FecR family protein n=1 Tax=Ascidiimonas meishanensis TaxID=3128903 RepID=UPI0030EEBC01
MSTENYLAKWLSGDLSDTELKAFQQHPEFQEYARIAAHTKNWKAPGYDVSKQLAILQKKVNSNEVKETKVIQMNPAKLWLRIAAAVVLIFGATYFMMRDTQVSTDFAQTDTVILPDDSEIILNAGSNVTYHKLSWDKNRSVKLDGEAYFKVEKGQTFDVVTNQGTVSVLGTQFNVKDRKDFFEVVCYEGLVKVTHELKQILLQPGESFKVVYGEFKEESRLKALEPSWIQKESMFKSVPLQMVFNELERQFNVKIQGVDNTDKQQLFTGGFKHNDLEKALQTVCIPLNLSFNINNDGTITIANL